MNDHGNNSSRDYAAISPSAKYVLLLKGNTDIPFARETAELISRPGVFEPDIANRDLAYWGGVVHLDARYKSIDQLLWEKPVNNILELSSGYSFRGLAAVKEHDVYYIDTDLPNMIRTKQDLVAALPTDLANNKGRLEILPLNALDEHEFKAVTGHFEAGEIAIVNEGLLMYLNMEEKAKLCQIVKHVLQERGGYWITADIYIKVDKALMGKVKKTELSDFTEKMNIRDNMFEDFDAAADFFRAQGFVIDKEAEGEERKSVALKYLRESATEEQMNYMKNAAKVRATWRLKLA